MRCRRGHLGLLLVFGIDRRELCVDDDVFQLLVLEARMPESQR